MVISGFTVSSSMNKKTQNVGLLAIIAVFAITLTVGNAGFAAATNESTAGGTGGHNYGNHDLVGKSTVGGDVTSHPVLSDKVCGDRLCSEPVPHVAKVSKVSEKQLPGHVPTIQTVEAFHYDVSGAPHAYIVVFKVTAGTANLSNIQVLIKSDIDQFDTNLGSLFAGENTDLVSHVHALDPTTITARVASYQVRDAGR